MTDIEQKALALLNEVRKEQGYPPAKWDSLDVEWLTIETIGRAIEQHEAFRQEVSDAVELANDRVKSLAGNTAFIVNHMQCFIIPAPKPDPLVDVLLEMELSSDLQESQHDAIEIRKALDKLGFEIREKNDDQ